MKMRKRVLAAFLSVIIIFICTACGEEERVIPPYEGILTKVRLGMPETRVTALQPEDADLYYQTGNDYIMWSVNPDTEIQSLRDYLPPEDMFYYCDDSIITYYLEDNDDKTEKVLSGYMQEVYCVAPRDVAVEFYNAQVKYLTTKYGMESNGTRTGIEGVDLNLDFKEVMTGTSFNITFGATFTSQTVNGVNDYYGTHFYITLMKSDNPTAVAVESGEMTVPTTTKAKTTKAETEAETETEAEATEPTASGEAPTE
jgi:hypothetical protein